MDMRRRIGSPFSITVFIVSNAARLIVAKFPCMNEGVPALISASQDSDFKCNCKPPFYGPFCEYSSDDKPTEGFEKQATKLIFCIFFLLILPTLIIYLVRMLYLFLKRCNDTTAILHRLNNHRSHHANPPQNLQQNQTETATTFQAFLIDTDTASLILQQQQTQRHQPLRYIDDESNPTISPTRQSATTIALLPFDYGSLLGGNCYMGNGLRRTRTAMNAAEAQLIGDSGGVTRQRRRGNTLHATRSLAASISPPPMLTTLEFGQLLRSLQQLHFQQQQHTMASGFPPPPPPMQPPPYDSVVVENEIHNYSNC